MSSFHNINDLIDTFSIIWVWNVQTYLIGKRRKLYIIKF